MPPDPVTENQYRIATAAAGLWRRADRGLLRVTGNDRAAWLHNLVTNAVKTLQPGDGNYAFAPNVQGRTLFDLNILVLDDQLWLDIDLRWFEAARKHLERYVITEDVSLIDATRDFERLAVVGPATADICGRLGLTNVAPMPQLQHVAMTWEGRPARLVRHDFVGVSAVEIVIGAGGADALETALLDAGRPSGLARIDTPTIDTLRIEAGIPAGGVDIDDAVIPPETLQVERGISYHKGCYLGQEVIERMRSHGVLAKRLCGMRFAGDQSPPTPCEIKAAGAVVGRLTSACWSYALGAPAGLGYVKSAMASAGTLVAAEASGRAVEGEVIKLPMRPAA